MSTFVSVGNAHQPFARLVKVVESVATALPQPVFVQHGHTKFRASNCVGAPFISMMDFEKRMRIARLVITQAGGGGVLYALNLGKVPVLVPRLADLGEAIDNHQVSWGRELARTERVVLCERLDQLLACVAEASERQQKIEIMSPREPSLVALVREALKGSE